MKMKIDNTILFKFEFVDRNAEQDILKNFLDKGSDKILWIYGESGTGKTFFIKKCMENNKAYQVVYVENKKGSTDGKCIIDLIDELQSISNQKFYDFFKKHYHGVKAIASDLMDSIPMLKIAKSEFLQYVLGKNFYIIDENNGYNDMASVLENYTKHILKEKKLVFVIDNLNQCDQNSFHILLNFAKSNIENSSCRFIFISTDSKDGNEPFEKQLSKELPYRDLCISKIPDEEYFINMLPRQFNVANLTQDDITEIYHYCQGLPERLQDLLANLNKNHSIEYNNTQILFNREAMLQYILSPDKYGLNMENYNYFQKCVLLTILCIGMPVKIDLLLKVSKVCYQKITGLHFSNEKGIDQVLDLQPKPLKEILRNGSISLYTDHDLTYNTALMYFNSNHMYPMFCEIIYEYLSQERPQEFTHAFDENAQKELFANLTYHAQHINWVPINFECGLTFYQSQNFIQASKYLRRLIDSIDRLNPEQILMIGITLYETGEYESACNILEEIPSYESTGQYLYYLYRGKSYNMTARKEIALHFFEKAIQSASPDSDNKIYAQYMKYLVMLQMPQYVEQAKNLYQAQVRRILNLYENRNEQKLYLISNARLLRCCYDYYFNEDALYLYKIAEEITEHCDNQLETASILHNKGFEYIRQNRIAEGRESFQKAFKLLENTKRHDAAYCLNNIAICKMFKKEYLKSVNDLKKVLLYEKSYYLHLTASAMLMQCYRILHNSQYNDLKRELSDIIEKNIYQDPAIIRKLCMNLAICEYEDGNNVLCKYYLDKTWKLIGNTSSEFRALKLRYQLNQDIVPVRQEYLFQTSDFFNTEDFEPWFITLSHD